MVSEKTLTMATENDMTLVTTSLAGGIEAKGALDFEIEKGEE
jgi:hypothetical protein